jgi:multiple sugar transport system permease protein
MTAGTAVRPRPATRWRASTSLAVLVACVLVSLPFLWMVSLAFTPADRAFATTDLIPGHPTAANFRTAVTQGGIGHAMLNSCLVAAGVVVTNCLFATMAGYAFATLHFRGEKIVFAAMVAMAMVPLSVTLIPMFLITKGLPFAGGNDVYGAGGHGLLDSLAGLGLPYLVMPLNIFLARQYYLDFPTELAESARTEGAGELRIFLRICLPLSKPLISTIAIFAFTGVWDDFLWPLVVTTSRSKQTVQLALAQFLASGNVQYGPVMAAAVLITLPVLAVFALNQRGFVSGLTEGGVKG